MRTSSLMAAVAFLIIGATSAAAQTQTPAGVPPAAGRFTLFFNGGLLTASQDISRSSTFDLYDEAARLDVSQNDVDGGGFAEIGGSYRFTDRFGAGLSYMRVTSTGDGSVQGSIPHPLVFDQFRPLSGTAPALDHKENTVHLFATWQVPMTEKMDLTISAGPSIFSLSQDFIRTVSFADAPPFTSVTLTAVERERGKETAVGFNIGVDAIYSAVRVSGFDLGLGANARYSRGAADFQISEEDPVSVTGGGFQVGAGVRVRF